MSILSMLPLVSDVLDRVIPDKNARAKAKQELDLLDRSGELQALLGQLAINAKEAEHPSLFVSGWRPAAGWTCVCGLFWQFVVLPIITFTTTAFGVIILVPDFDTATLITLLGALLGIGTVRTVEKIKGVSRK